MHLFLAGAPSVVVMHLRGISGAGGCVSGDPDARCRRAGAAFGLRATERKNGAGLVPRTGHGVTESGTDGRLLPGPRRREAGSGKESRLLRPFAHRATGHGHARSKDPAYRPPRRRPVMPRRCITPAEAVRARKGASSRRHAGPRRRPVMPRRCITPAEAVRARKRCIKQQRDRAGRRAVRPPGVSPGDRPRRGRDRGGRRATP
jgi:hypothetical protein